MKNKIRGYTGIFLIIICITINMTGCKEFLSQGIMNSSLDQEYINTFYGKGVQSESINGKEVGYTEFEEWKGEDSNYRVDVYSQMTKDYYETYDTQKIEGEKQKIHVKYLYSANEVSIYYPDKKEYIVKPIQLEDEVKGTLSQGINNLIANGSAKVRTMSIVSALYQNYELEIEDDVKLNGRNTQHVIATDRKNSNNKQEFWIDQQNWLILKTYSKQGNYEVSFEYLSYKLNPSISEKIFDDKKQAGATIAYLGSNNEILNQNIEFKKSPYYLEAPVLYLDETNLKLVSTKYIKEIDKAKGTIRLTYNTDDGKEIIVDTSINYSIYNEIDFGYDKLHINGMNAYYYEEYGTKGCQLTKQDIICNLYVKNSEITENEIILLACKLKLLPYRK